MLNSCKALTDEFNWLMFSGMEKCHIWRIIVETLEELPFIS